MAGYVIHRTTQDSGPTKKLDSGSAPMARRDHARQSMCPCAVAARARLRMPSFESTCSRLADASSAGAVLVGARRCGGDRRSRGGRGGCRSRIAGSEGVDPTEVEDVDPAKGSASKAEDEDENAPKTTEQIEKRERRRRRHLASTISEAVALIKEGKREMALASLRGLWKKSPNSAYIPFLLGNLYFDSAGGRSRWITTASRS